MDIEDGGGGACGAQSREMVTPALRGALTKQGYKLVGSHSGVKLCRWTKAMLRGRGGCYKHTFYGIESHRVPHTRAPPRRRRTFPPCALACPRRPGRRSRARAAAVHGGHAFARVRQQVHLLLAVPAPLRACASVTRKHALGAAGGGRTRSPAPPAARGGALTAHRAGAGTTRIRWAPSGDGRSILALSRSLTTSHLQMTLQTMCCPLPPPPPQPLTPALADRLPSQNRRRLPRCPQVVRTALPAPPRPAPPRPAPRARARAAGPGPRRPERAAARRAAVGAMRGVPGVQPARLAEGLAVRHCALSLVGEPIMCAPPRPAPHRPAPPPRRCCHAATRRALVLHRFARPAAAAPPRCAAPRPARP